MKRHIYFSPEPSDTGGNSEPRDKNIAAAEAIETPKTNNTTEKPKKAPKAK